MRATLLARTTIAAFTLAVCCAAEMPTADQIIEKVVAQEDLNYEKAKNWEFEQHLVTQRLDGDEKVKSEKTKTITYRPEGKLSFSVGGLKDQGDKAEVGIGLSNDKDDEKEGKFSEALKMRELQPFYVFSLVGEGDLNGEKVWMLDFEPKPDMEEKAEGQKQKVLTRLHGRLWIHPKYFAIMKADCSLVRPMPFAWLDLVSLRILRIQYETVFHENKVWLPKSMEVYYLVRILFLSHIRERQTMTADGYREVPAEKAEVKPKKE